MPVKWDPVADQRLLLLVVDQIKPDYAKLAKDWQDKYGTDDNSAVPTERALVERFKTLRSQNKNGGPSRSTPASVKSKSVASTRQSATPIKKAKSGSKKPLAAPKSDRKRKRAGQKNDDEASMSDAVTDEDDVGGHIEADVRRSSSRNLSQQTKNYTELEEDQDQVENADASPSNGVHGRKRFKTEESDDDNYSGNDSG